MIKKFGKALPYVLAGTIAMNTFTGCGISKTVKQPAVVQEYSLEDLDIAEEAKVEDLTPVVEKEEKREVELFDNYTVDLDELDRLKNAEDKTSMEHINALYSFVRKYSIGIDNLLEEFENILMAKHVNLADFDYYRHTLYPNLNFITLGDEDVVELFYPLAKYIHEQYCTLEHTEENGNFYCPKIDERIDRLNETTLLNGVLTEEVEASDDEKLKSELNRIYRSNRYDECLSELENLYLLSIVPQCLEGYELEEIFPALLETVGERENIFEVYYELAFYRHMMLCEEDHTLNEFGRYECESAKKKVLGK